MFLVLKRRRLDLFSLMERSLTWWHCQLRFESIFIPMYLTLSLIFYCIILFLNHLQIYFAWTLRFHFFFYYIWSEILFGFNRLTRCFKSALTSLFCFLMELLLIRNRYTVISQVVNLANFFCSTKVVEM